MAKRFLSNIRINDAYTFPASDGTSGQVVTTDGAGNLSFAEAGASDSASVIYRDNFTGDGAGVSFDLQNSITDEDQTQIYIDGVYQEKDTYSVSGSTITFTTAPISGHSIEVISISAINTGPTVIYQDNFTGNGSATDFTLANAIDNEVKTLIFLNGVYQFKNTYSVDGTTLGFDAAPANGVDIEVISIASATQADSLQAGSVIVPVKNTHTASIAKGTPVYISGNVGNSARLQIAPADASNSAKMPAAGLLLTTLAVNAEGYAITGGYLRNITTDTIDGTSTASNDTVYVKAGGGLTMTKPTGSNLIQNIAKIARSSGGNSGSLLVSSILRTNDIPNIANDNFWLGNSSSVATATSFPTEVGNYLTTNSYATENYVDTEVAGLVASAPTTLDTLNELAAALGDDPNFATTTATSIGLKAPLASPSFTGDATFSGSVTTDKIIIDGASNSNVSQFALTRTDFSWGIFNETNLRFYVQSGNTTTPNGQVLEIATNGNATFAGNVTIDSNLTINGPSTKFNTDGDSFFEILDAGTDACYLRAGAGDEIYIGANNNYQLRLKTNKDVVMDNGGNLGIGTDSPAEILHIEQDDASPVLLVKASGQTSSTAPYAKLVLAAGSASGADVGSNIMGYRTADFSSAAARSTGLKFGVLQNNVAKDAMWISEAQNVGIGTDSPNYLLDIEGASPRIRVKETSSNTSTTMVEVENSDGRGAMLGVGGSGRSDILTNRGYINAQTALDGLAIGTEGTDPIIFYTQGLSASNEKMRITSAGQVNITKGSSGTVLYLDGVNAYNAETGIQLSAGRAKISGFLNATGGTPGSSLRFYTMPDGGSVTERMHIDSSGAVLIGNGVAKIDSATKLQVSASDSGVTTIWSNADDIVFENNNNFGITLATPSTGAATIAFADPEAVNEGYIQYVHGDDYMRFATNQLERMRIKSNGIIEARADISSYTNMSTAFAAYGDTDPGEYGIVLNTAGDGLSGSITSNLMYSNGTITQPNTARSSGEIRFNNTTVASQTADIQFGGYYKGSTTFVTRMNIGVTGRILMPGLDGKTQVHPDVSYRTSDGELFYQTSSERYKTNIVNLENCLDKVNSLRTVRFTDVNTNEPGFGLIAEETNEIIPEVVFSKDEQIEGISYSNLVPFLIKSIQELKADNDSLKARIETLENN